MLKKVIVLVALVASVAAQTKKPKSTPAAAPTGTAAAANETVALKGGKLLTITHGAKVIDVTGMTVYPGLIDSETHLGLTEVSADRMTVDTLEPSDEIMPHMHVADAFHAETALIP